MQQAGATLCAASDRSSWRESTNADRIVIVEFDTAAQARAFYHSAAYQAARQKRLPAAEFRMTLVEGPPAS